MSTGKDRDMADPFRILAQSAAFVLGYEYETVLLVHRQTGKCCELGRHYGDPVAGIISPDEQWFIVVGEGLVYFDFSRGLHEFWRGGETVFVSDIRLQGSDEVRVLVDPWSSMASVWLLNIAALTLEKLHDGPALQGKPFQEDVPF